MQFDSKNFSLTIIDLIIKIGFIIVLGIAAFDILSPFITLIVWSLIFTITLVPLHNRLSRWFGNSRKIAASLITIVFLAIIIGPFGFIVSSLIENLKEVKEQINIEAIAQWHPDEKIKEWPFVGGKVFGLMQEFADNRESFIENHQDKIISFGEFILVTITSAGKSVLLFVSAMLISGFLLMFTEERQSLGVRIAKKLAGDKGVGFATLSENTVRSVVTGVLGVAVIQALLAGIGFFIMDIPYAGVWTLVALFLAIIQIGVGPIVIGAVVYGFMYHDITPAVLFLIWNILVTLSDNVLKPILMGRGLGVPMLVIFIGAIGGMLHNGILGLFLGPVILALSYKLFTSWLEEGKNVSEIVFEEEKA